MVTDADDSQERGAAGQQMEQDCAESVNVAVGTHRGSQASGLLRRNIVGRAENLTGEREGLCDYKFRIFDFGFKMIDNIGLYVYEDTDPLLNIRNSRSKHKPM